MICPYAVYKSHFRSKRTNKLNERMEKRYSLQFVTKKVGGYPRIRKTIDFISKFLEKENHYILIKGLIDHRDTRITNTHTDTHRS